MIDQFKTGRFIAEKRKEQNLTQAQLAERLNITDRAVSKWENGRSLPDSSIMLNLCKILEISVNDLLYGEETEMNEKNNQQLLIELTKEKQEGDKKLLDLEIVIGFLAIIILLSFTFAASYFQMTAALRIFLIVAGFLISFTGLFFALRIEQTAGYYKCKKCGHCHVPSFKSVLWAPHVNRTRYMKCPKCGKKSWQRKVVSKEQ